MLKRWENCKVICGSSNAWSGIRANDAVLELVSKPVFPWLLPITVDKSCLSGQHIIFIHYSLLWWLGWVLIDVHVSVKKTHYGIWEKRTAYLGDLDEERTWNGIRAEVCCYGTVFWTCVLWLLSLTVDNLECNVLIQRTGLKSKGAEFRIVPAWHDGKGGSFFLVNKVRVDVELVSMDNLGWRVVRVVVSMTAR